MAGPQISPSWPVSNPAIFLPPAPCACPIRAAAGRDKASKSAPQMQQDDAHETHGRTERSRTAIFSRPPPALRGPEPPRGRSVRGFLTVHGLDPTPPRVPAPHHPSSPHCPFSRSIPNHPTPHPPIPPRPLTAHPLTAHPLTPHPLTAQPASPHPLTPVMAGPRPGHPLAARRPTPNPGGKQPSHGFLTVHGVDPQCSPPAPSRSMVLASTPPRMPATPRGPPPPAADLALHRAQQRPTRRAARFACRACAIAARHGSRAAASA